MIRKYLHINKWAGNILIWMGGQKIYSSEICGSEMQSMVESKMVFLVLNIFMKRILSFLLQEEQVEVPGVADQRGQLLSSWPRPQVELLQLQ